jgi:hypothetical protein
MKVLATLIFGLIAFVASAAEHPKEYYDPDVQRLIKVERFAFGPVGFDQTISDGEKAFGAIVQKAEAVRYVLQVFDHGTVEARCYALVALREYSPQLFSDSVDIFLNTAPAAIAVQEGTIVSPVTPQKVLENIRRGLYHKYFEQYEK